MAWTKAGPGRPKGARSKRNAETIAKAQAVGIMPLEVMLEAMRAAYDRGDLKEAHDFAKDAAPYLHSKLATTELKGNADSPINVGLTVKFVGS